MTDSTDDVTPPSWTPGPTVDAERWTKLIRDDAPVGFMRQVGSVTMYSADGYGWSGVPIDYDHGVADTRLRDARRGRVFHGDVVVMPFTPTTTKTTQAVILERARNAHLATKDPRYHGPRRPVASPEQTDERQGHGRLEERTDLAIHADAFSSLRTRERSDRGGPLLLL